MIERPERPDTLPETALLTRAPSQTNALRPSVERHVGDTCRELGDKHLGRGRGGTMSSNQEEKQWAERGRGSAESRRRPGFKPLTPALPCSGAAGDPSPRTRTVSASHLRGPGPTREQIRAPSTAAPPPLTASTCPCGRTPSRWRRPREFAGPSHSPGGAAFTQSTQSKPADATPPPPLHRVPAWSILVGVRKPAV